MSTPIVDCHTHTSFSDGASTFEQNVADAARAGVRVLACPSPWAATHTARPTWPTPDGDWQTFSL